MDLARLVEQLSDPAFYPEPTTAVEVVQTHISYIFLTDRYAYKVKKPVDFGFLDYTTLERRRTMCEREVALNSRLCPSTYLGVVELREHDGALAIDGPGETVEVAVRMLRLPHDRTMLRQVLARGEGQRRVVRTDRRDRRRLPPPAPRRRPRPPVLKGFDGVKFNCDENFAQTEKYVDALVPRGRTSSSATPPTCSSRATPSCSAAG